MLMISFLMLFMTGCEVSCWGVVAPNPIDPDDPEPDYRIRLKITYNRNPANIRFPGGLDQGTQVNYELYDPEAEKHKTDDDRFVDTICRYGSVTLEKKDENYFVGYIEKVFVQNDNYNSKHKSQIRDHKLHDGVSHFSMYTVDGLVIEPVDSSFSVTDVYDFSNQRSYKLKKK